MDRVTATVLGLPFHDWDYRYMTGITVTGLGLLSSGGASAPEAGVPAQCRRLDVHLVWHLALADAPRLLGLGSQLFERRLQVGVRVRVRLRVGVS